MQKKINLSPQAEQKTSYENESVVSSRDFKVLRKNVAGASASLEVLAGQILLKANQSSVDSLSGRVTTAESSIAVNAANILLKVSTTDYTGTTLVSMINILPDTIKIAAKNLVLSGLVTFDNLSTSGQTTINGDNITTGTLNASVVNVTNINASNINAGSLTVDRLTVGTVSGWYFGASTISRNGITLGADYITLSNTGTGGSTINLGSAKIYNIGGTTVGVSGGLTVSGSVACGNISADNVTVDSITVVNTSNLRHTYPVSSGVYNLGQSGNRWADVWCTDAAFNGSDIRLKKEVKQIEKGVELILGLNPVQWKWNWKEDGRNHWGFVANELKETMDKLGIDGGVYGNPKLSKNYKKEEDENGYLALRYTELIAPMVQTIQDIYKRVEKLENAKN